MHPKCCRHWRCEAPFGATVEDFYQTNPIARASSIMAWRMSFSSGVMGRAGEPMSLRDFLEANKGESDETIVRRGTYALVRKIERERRAWLRLHDQSLDARTIAARISMAPTTVSITIASQYAPLPCCLVIGM